MRACEIVSGRRVEAIGVTRATQTGVHEERAGEG